MNEPSPIEASCPRCGTPLVPDLAHGLCPRCVFAAGVETKVSPLSESSAPAASANTPSPSDLAAYFPMLKIIELTGRGGMGWVYKAHQTALDRVVALKLLPPDVAAAPAFAERFQREARALARLNHPNIVAVYDFGQAGPYFYLVMEFVDGANLRQLERTHRLSPEEAFSLVPRLCDALQYAHEEGVVHRDVKPENILIDTRGRLKIVDFGIAKLVGGKNDLALTGTWHAVGTPSYMAPEQFETPGRVDHRADIYALGVVFYEMLTGELPVGRFEPPSRHVQVDVRLDEVVLKSLERDPERRYQTAGAVKSAVESISGTVGPAPAPFQSAASQAPGVEGTRPDQNDGPVTEAPTADPVTGTAHRIPVGVDPGAFSVLGRAWRDWWAERAKWVAVAVQGVLVVIHLGCLFAFIGTSIRSQWNAGGHRQFTYALGARDPWFKFETYPTANTPFRSGLNPVAGSMVFLIVGFAVYYAIWRIEKIRKPKVGFWSSPAAMGLLWGLFAVAAIAMGTKMGHDALAEDSLGGHFAPQLRSALAVSGTSDRDQALAALALKAAPAKDIKSVQHALREIRDGTLHDRTAADCALALAKLLGGAEAAGALASEIRDDSLRDATLARISSLSPAE